MDNLEPIARLTKDLKAAQRTLSPREARYLVDLYYVIQEDRKRAGNQVKAMTKSAEPHELLGWVLGASETLENDIRRVLDAWSMEYVEGRWARSICGIGPVLASGLIAHIDITQAPTVGHIWRFAGLDPTVVWSKGQKRPWNAGLKVVCWKIGQSFMKLQANPGDIYGQVYAARKTRERERNDAGMFSDQAEAALKAKKYGKETNAYLAYSQGKLPDAQIDARARRYAVKLFLASFHEVAYYCRYEKLPPKPYAISILGHADWFQAPNPDVVPGLREAQENARKGFM